MSDDLVERADEALKDVTPGPWLIGLDSEAYVDGDCDTWIAVGPDDYEAVALVIDERFQKDMNIGLTARFIAAARELVPLMRDRIEGDAKRIDGLIAAAEARNALLDDQDKLIAQLAQEARAAEARVKELEDALREIADCERYDDHNGEFVPTEEAFIARAALEGDKTDGTP